MTKSKREDDYPCIQRWGHYMGSSQYYIEDEIALARMDKAPPTAIYKKNNGWDEYGDRIPDGPWITAEEIQDPMVREKILNG